MNQTTFSRLVEFSQLPDAEREAALDRAQPREIQDYLRALDIMGSIQTPTPSASKKWAGRNQLLQAVEAEKAERASSFSLPRWFRTSRLALAAAGVSAAVFVSAAAGAPMTGWPGTDSAFSEVLSALGLQSHEKANAPVLTPASPQDVPGNQLGHDVTPVPDQSEEPANIENQPQDPTGRPTEPAAVPPGQASEPPGQGGENPGNGGGNGTGAGQGGTPPGQGGETPGQGVDPPGQGGESPGQGAEPPGQGSENPGQGQGADPQGQGGESSGQGSGPQSQGSEGQSGGQVSEGSGQGQKEDPPGQGAGNSNKP